MKMKYYAVLYTPECILKDGTAYLTHGEFIEFNTLKKARSFMRKFYKQTRAEEPCEWLETNHNSCGVPNKWFVRLERGTHIRYAMPIK